MVAQLLDNQNDTVFYIKEYQERTMLSHLEHQKESLMSRGFKPFLGEVEPGEIVLSWTGENKNRYSLSVWLEDSDAFMSTVNGNKVIDEKSYSYRDFLNFTV